MRALWPSVQRGLVWFHRWAGVALCLLFIMWFGSGAVMHFVPFPSLLDRERLQHSESIDFQRLRVEPASVLALKPDATSLRLISVLSRPVYLAAGSGGSPLAVAGDSGAELPALTAAEARIVAERFSNNRAVEVTGPLVTDQWVVHQGFDAYRPYFRVRMADDQATDLYVSLGTGEVRQQTRRSERAWNWCGAVIHWIYFTPLRANWSAWNQTVWWVSLVALITTVAGIWLGLHRYLALRASGRAGLSPYRGWMWWHHVVGLFGGLIVLTWIFSGWLSMDHGRLFSKDGTTQEYVSRLKGLSIHAVATAVSVDTLRMIPGATSVSFEALGGSPFLAIEGRAPAESHDLWLLESGAVTTEAPPEALLEIAIRKVWPTAVRLITSSNSIDDLYRHAESIPGDAEAFSVPGTSAQRLYVDHLTGRLLAVMDPSRRSYAWVYYALHTFNYPALIALPWARTIIVLTLLFVGVGLSVTSVVLATRRVRRELS
jgi:hypothetical protein